MSRYPESEQEKVQIAANGYIVPNFPFGLLGGAPHQLVIAGRKLWIVPIMLTSPGIGAVGEVGVVALDAHTNAVLGSTSRHDVVTARTQLLKKKQKILDTAFRELKRQLACGAKVVRPRGTAKAQRSGLTKGRRSSDQVQA